MPILIDDTLDPSLFPLAWIAGHWQGQGAVQLPGPDGELVGRAVEQELVIEPDSSAGMTWTMHTYVLDAPAPEPPTSAFYENDGAAATENEDSVGEPVRELLLEEQGTFRVSGPLPGQDVEAAKSARRGSPESYLSHGLTLTMRRSSAFGPSESEHWAGEVRGPRIQLASQSIPDPYAPGSRVHAARMFGLVGGKLMWLQEVGPSLRELKAHLSMELERAEELSEEEVAEAVAEAQAQASKERPADSASDD